ncbi:MAG: prolipoprotein diacylglyceryl transferase [Saprospiraceae bacterium]|nr:prolipoprotein diacylglyceryl transferase [Saprospiraceae bacterium]
MNNFSFFPVIHIENTNYLFDLFFVLAFSTGFLYLLISGYKKSFHLLSWLLLILSMYIGFIVGSKFGAIAFDQWDTIYNGQFSMLHTKKSAIGGLFMGLSIFFLLKKLLKFEAPVLPIFAVFFPLFIIIQRFGCLFAGCCYGTPTDAVFGITYGKVGKLYDQHLDMNLIDLSASNTHAVHPYPMYLIIGSIITLIVLATFKNKFKNQSSLFFVSFFCLNFFRFFAEFFREASSNHNIQGAFWGGLKMLQWLLLLGMVVNLSIIFFLEWKKEMPKYKAYQIIPARIYLTIILLSLFIFITRNTFSLPELYVIQGVIIVICGFLFYNLYYQTVINFKWIPLSIIGFSFFTMSQTIDKGTAAHSIGISTTSTNIINSYYNCTKVDQGCLGKYCSERDTFNPIGPKYFGLNLNYDYVSLATDRKYRLNYGVNTQFDFFSNKVGSKNNYFLNIHPYVGYYGNLIHMRFGLHMGNIFTNFTISDKLFDESTKNTSNFLLSYRLQIGQQNKHMFLFKLNIFDDDYINAGLNSYSFYLQYNPKISGYKYINGIGFGQSNLSVRNGSIYYLKTDFDLDENFNCNLFFGLTTAKEFNVYGISNNEMQEKLNFGIGLNYKFIK